MTATHAVQRSLRLLELAAARPQGFSHTQACRYLSLPKVMVSRLLIGLCQEGMLAKGRDGLYQPAARLQALQAAAGQERRLLALIAPELPAVARACGNSAAIMHWNGQRAICLASQRVAGSFPIMVPGHLVANPQGTPWGVFLLPSGIWNDLIRDDADTRQWYRRERKRLREQGYCQKMKRDRHILGSPLHDQNGSLLGAVTVVGTPRSLDAIMISRQVGPALASEAGRCSRLLWRGS
jgi:DNA-binding IclR family transcriptional regulator